MTTTSGPGIDLKSEAIGLAISLELPLHHHRRPARRALDGPAHEGRAVRPLAGDVRAPRRAAAADRRGEDPEPLLRRGARGRPHRGHLPHAGDPALGRVPRERLGALADPRRRRAAHASTLRSPRRRTTSTPTAPSRSGRTCATTRRSRGRGRRRGCPGLEHRIGGLEKSDGPGLGLLRRGEPRARWRGCATTASRRIADTIPDVVVDDPTAGRRDARRRLGLDRRRDRRGGRARCARAVSTSPARTSCTSTRSRRTSASVLARYERVLVPELNLGQLARLLRAEFLVDATPISKVQGLPFRASELEAGHPRRAGGAPMTQVADPDDAQGLDERPGGPLVPGLRGLLDPRGAPDAHARARRAARVDRLRLGHRLRGAVPVLHEHLRAALDPRSRARARDRARRDAARPRRLGHRRRRRHAVDRRQPPHPRAASQREPHDPDVQQPDLRADQGPVLADVRGGQGHEVDAVRLDRRAVQPDLDRARRRGDVRRAHPRHGPRAHAGDVPARPRAPRRRRSSRCSRTATCSTTAPSRSSRAATGAPTCSSRSPTASRSGSARTSSAGSCSAPTARVELVDVADVGEDALFVHDEARERPRTSPSRSRGSATRRHTPTPIGVFRDVERVELGDGDVRPDRRSPGVQGTGRPGGAVPVQRHLDD